MKTSRKQSLSTTTVSNNRSFIPIDKSYGSVGDFCRDLELSLSSHNHIYIFNDDYDERTTVIAKTNSIGKLEYYQAVIKNGHMSTPPATPPSSRRSDGIAIKPPNGRARASSIPSLNAGTPPTDHEDDDYDVSFSTSSTPSSVSVLKERASTPTSKSPTHNHNATKHDDQDGDVSVTAHPIKDLSAILVKSSRNHDETTVIIRSYVVEVRYGKESSGNIQCKEGPCICEIGDECHLDRLHEIRGYRIARSPAYFDYGDKGDKVECRPMRTDNVLELFQHDLAIDLASHEIVY